MFDFGDIDKLDSKACFRSQSKYFLILSKLLCYITSYKLMIVHLRYSLLLLTITNYLKCFARDELKIFNREVIISPTTTLGLVLL